MLPHLTVPEIAARMGVSAATAKRRIAEWIEGTGAAPMRPGRAIVLTEAEFSQVMEFTRSRSRGSLPAPMPVPSLGPPPRRGRFAKLREQERRGRFDS